MPITTDTATIAAIASATIIASSQGAWTWPPWPNAITSTLPTAFMASPRHRPIRPEEADPTRSLPLPSYSTAPARVPLRREYRSGASTAPARVPPARSLRIHRWVERARRVNRAARLASVYGIEGDREWLDAHRTVMAGAGAEHGRARAGRLRTALGLRWRASGRRLDRHAYGPIRASRNGRDRARPWRLLVAAWPAQRRRGPRRAGGPPLALALDAPAGGRSRRGCGSGDLGRSRRRAAVVPPRRAASPRDVQRGGRSGRP